MTPRPSIFFLLSLLFFGALPLAGADPASPLVASWLQPGQLAQAKVTLYSLDPAQRSDSKNQAEAFHHFLVRGHAEIMSDDEKRALFQAASTTRPNGSPVAACFNPRHGLRIESSQGTLDLVICYECGQVDTYANGGQLGGYLLDGSPAVFNRALREHGLPTTVPAS